MSSKSIHAHISDFMEKLITYIKNKNFILDDCPWYTTSYTLEPHIAQIAISGNAYNNLCITITYHDHNKMQSYMWHAQSHRFHRINWIATEVNKHMFVEDWENELYKFITEIIN